ncbi:MAG: type II secretion system F family protein [Patescibacteria group bacterium]
MDQYQYEARDVGGRVVKGLVEADSPEAVEDILKYNKLSVISVKSFLTTEQRILGFFKSMFGKIKPGDKAVFARQLATMINAGLPLMEALRSIIRQTPNKNLVLVTLKIIALIEKGKSFSYAVSQFPNVFSPVFVNMVKSGEASGKMDKVLVELADQLESDYAMRSKIKSALMYPAFILTALVAVATFALIYIIPSLEDVFASAGSQLPVTTRMLIWLSHFMASYWYLALLVLIGIAILFRYFMMTFTGKRLAGYIALRAPIFKKINGGIYVTNFSKTLGLLLASGVPIIRSLSMVAEAVGNIYLEEKIKDAIVEVEKGVPLSVPLSRIKEFPSLVSSMVAVGEQTGKLDEILIKIAHIYEEETNTTLKGLTSLLEPVIMLVIGLGVAFLVISILLPIFQLSNVL